MEKQLLVELGLSESESDVYLVVLKHGTISISGLSRATGIKRTTLYAYIDELLSRGYIGKTIVGKRMRYVAENPGKLSTELENKKKKLDQAMPSLLAAYKSGSHEPGVTVFHGKQGLLSILRQIEDEAWWIKTFFSPERWESVFPISVGREFIANLIKKGATVHDLFDDTTASRRLLREQKAEHSAEQKIKILPKGLQFDIEIIIYKDKIAMLSFEHLFGVIIDNKEIARFHESVFDHFWKTLK